jgi:polygalacturonase
MRLTKRFDAAVAAGGGTVEFPTGTYVTGSIRLRSNIRVQLDRGAVLEAISDASA